MIPVPAVKFFLKRAFISGNCKLQIKIIFIVTVAATHGAKTNIT
jgi:hypothetical protein